MDEKLLNDITMLLYSIQGSRKGSVGSFYNIYCCQLDVKAVNDITNRLSQYRKQLLNPDKDPNE